MLCSGSQRFRVLFLIILFENTDFWKKSKILKLIFAFSDFFWFTIIQISFLAYWLFFPDIYNVPLCLKTEKQFLYVYCVWHDLSWYLQMSHCVSRRRSSSCMFIVCGMTSPDIYRCQIVSLDGEAVLACLLFVACPPLIFIDVPLCLMQGNQFWHVYCVWHVLPWYLQMSHRVPRRRIRG